MRQNGESADSEIDETLIREHNYVCNLFLVYYNKSSQIKTGCDIKLTGYGELNYY